MRFVILGLLALAGLVMMSLPSDASAQVNEVRFDWQQPNDPGATWAILYVGTSEFDPDADDAVNGDVHAVVEVTPVPQDGVVVDGVSYDRVHTLVMTTPIPLPDVKLYRTMKAQVGDGKPSEPSNTSELIHHIPIPDAPVLLGEPIVLDAVISIRLRERQ